jgi:hypothetical protein
MKRTLAVLCSLALPGCALVAAIEARTEYQKTVAEYRACLNTNPNDPKACDGKRLAMEARARI